MNRSFKIFCKNFTKLSKKEILKLFYDYIRKENGNEKKRRKRKI